MARLTLYCNVHLYLERPGQSICVSTNLGSLCNMTAVHRVAGFAAATTKKSLSLHENLEIHPFWKQWSIANAAAPNNATLSKPLHVPC
jgi:hypothetical protein